MLPLTPFFVYNENIFELFEYRSGWRQKRPYDLPTEYYCKVYKKMANTWPNSPVSWQLMEQNIPTGAPTGVKVTAYERFLGKLGDRAELGVAFAELGEACSMVSSRALQLWDFTRHLRRGNFAAAAKTLEMPVPKKVGTHKKLASNWLEFSFGWAPLVDDIGTAIDVLQRPISNRTIFGYARDTFSYVTGEWFGDYDIYCDGVPHRAHQKRVISGKYFCRYQATVGIDNPNLYLANQLGFVNPAAIAWELVPFSFVLDWFTNVGQFLSQGTDLLGLTIQDPFTSSGTKDVILREDTTWVNCQSPYLYWEWRGRLWRREKGLVTPSLGLRTFRPWGWKRGANAISLLLLQMKS